MTDIIQKIKETEQLVSQELELMELNERINKVVKSGETFQSEVLCAEQLSSDNFKLPLPIRGKMIGVGRHYKRYYTAEELKKSVENFKAPIALKYDHQNKHTSATIGAINNLKWDEERQAVIYEGHINDETAARNVLDKVINEVSATIFANNVQDETYGLMGKNLEYGELSFVEKGAYKGNSLEVDT